MGNKLHLTGNISAIENDREIKHAKIFYFFLKSHRFREKPTFKYY